MWFTKKSSSESELKALRKENAALKQQLDLTNELVAAKTEVISLLRSREGSSGGGFLSSCAEVLGAGSRSAHAAAGSSAGTSSSHSASFNAEHGAAKRSRHAGGFDGSALDREEALYHIFTCLGAAEHLYVSGVCWRWRRVYTKYSSIIIPGNGRSRTLTRYAAAVASPSRLRLALACTPPIVDGLSNSLSAARTIVKDMDSETAIEVLTLARNAGTHCFQSSCRYFLHLSSLSSEACISALLQLACLVEPSTQTNAAHLCVWLLHLQQCFILSLVPMHLSSSSSVAQCMMNAY
jgi:hypothetical protein